MKERRLRSVVRDVRRLVVATIAVAAILLLTPGLLIPTADASVAADRKDDRKDKKDAKKQDDDRGEDFVLNGQVLEINADKNPPEMIVGTVDGRARVRVIKTDEIARNGVEVGDYVELTGEKVNELLFNADEISVGERASASASSADDNDNSGEDDSSEDEED